MRNGRPFTQPLSICALLVACLIPAAAPASGSGGVPTSSSPPQISGTAAVGQTLTASPGSWTSNPTAYSYRWERCSGGSCSATGGTAQSYVPAVADAGDTIGVIVTASNKKGSGTATTAPVGPVVAQASPLPAATPAPVVTITSPLAGATLDGNVSFTATVSNVTPTRVEFTVDGGSTWTESLSPYVYNGDGNTLDTTTLSNGSHTLAARAYLSDGSSVATSIQVNVQNSSTPAASPAGVGNWYSSSSPFNLPIPSNASPLPTSSTLANMLVGTGQAINVNTYGWTPPVYYATSSTPLASVDIVDDYHTYRIDGVPIPGNAVTSPDNNNSGISVSGDGNDNYLQIVDPVRGCEYDFWKAYKDSSGNWHAKNEATFTLGGSGVHTPWAVRASGIALGAGIIRPEDIQAGVINHALGWAVPSTISGSSFVSPAQSTDGPAMGGIPMGTLFQLDPNINLDTFQPQLAPWMKTIARAMQTYGVYVTDTSTGSIALQAQSTVSTGGSVYPWPQYSSLPKELLSHFRAVTSPATAVTLDTWSTSGCSQRTLIK
jgi:Big-like domain-containing protein